jgi:tripartite-type tricarboxylate transporter receptor subunit TctC
MALKIRRVVTGHDDNGRAVVAVDEICKNVMSRRPNHESCVVWSTGSFPADNSGTEDGGLRPVATTDPNGTVFRIGVYHPGVAPRNHRTESIDYAIVLSGEIDMEIDGAIVHLRAREMYWSSVEPFTTGPIRAPSPAWWPSCWLRPNRWSAPESSSARSVEGNCRNSRESKVKVRILLVALVCVLTGQAQAQSNYPSRPVRIVVPSPPAGGTDIIARVLAQYFSNATGQQFYVENRAGAGNMIGIESVARAAPDGYTLLFVPSTLALNSVMYKKISYDPVRDFAPITLAAAAPNVLVVNPKVPARSIAELIALAKQKPGQLTYGTPGIGTSPHMAMELFKSLADVDLQHIPYRGTAPAMTDVISGQITAMFSNALTAKPQIESGAVRALGVSSRTRSESMPNVPPIAEAGVPNYEATQWYGLVAPAGTPPDIIARLHAEATQALKTQDMKDKLASDGAEPVGTTPAEFAAHIKSELEKWANVARVAKIEPQ